MMAILFVGAWVCHSAERSRNIRRPVPEHKEIVAGGCNKKADEPGVVIEESQTGNSESDQRNDHTGNKRGNRPRIYATRVLVRASATIERDGVKTGSANQEIISNHDACNRAEQSGVADEPTEDVAAKAAHQLPRHHRKPQQA